MKITEYLKIILFGIVEGYTEWLPISSTGHLILLENLIPIDQPEAFWNVFKVVIQFGAILAVVVIYWNKLWPFARVRSRGESRGRGPARQRDKTHDTLILWSKIIAACVPAAVLGLLLDDFLDAYLSTPTVIAVTLILYGVIFIALEAYYKKKKKRFPINSTAKIGYGTAFFIGLFQCLSLIPGTSRSGATILGAMLLGCSRPAAAEFSFFLGIPTMAGASLLKVVKYGFNFTGEQIFVLILGMAAAFIVALFSVRFLVDYVRRHDFSVFGYYRIVLGILVLLLMR